VSTVEPLPGEQPAITLLVDDEREYVTTLAERLEMRALPCHAVYDGYQALAFLEDHAAPEVIVLDLRMPGMDGIEVLRRVRRHFPDIAVIVVTAHGTEVDERLVRDLGAFDYLRKPVDVNNLAERIKAAARHARHVRK